RDDHGAVADHADRLAQEQVSEVFVAQYAQIRTHCSLSAGRGRGLLGSRQPAALPLGSISMRERRTSIVPFNVSRASTPAWRVFANSPRRNGAAGCRPPATRSAELPAAGRPDPAGLLLGRVLRLHQAPARGGERAPARDDAGVPERG